MGEMHSVKSRDGVSIAFWKSGRGPHLVLVHGTSADHTRWRPVLPMFEEHFTVCAVDRRGRGGSGDAEAYSLEREFDDVAALCDTLEGPVHLLGHSFGALCAMEAALRTNHLGKLVLYEPGIAVEGPSYPPNLRQRMERLVEQRDREGVLYLLFRELLEMPDREMEALRADPSWQGRLAAAHTVPREFEDEDYVLDPARFQGLRTPVLLLSGGDSPRFIKAATEAVHVALPNSRIVVMPGQQHAAITVAPELFAEQVLRFLLESNGA